MKIFARLSFSKYHIVLTVLVISLGVFIIAPGFFFKSESDIPFLSFIIDSYLAIVEKFSNILLRLFGTDFTILNHAVTSKNGETIALNPVIWFRKWTLIFVILILITKGKWSKKLMFAGLILLLHYLINTIYITSDAFCSMQGNKDSLLLNIILTSGIMVLFTIVFIWYKNRKEYLLNKVRIFKINYKLFENDLHFGSVAYIFMLLYYFIFEIFDFHIWINLLFNSSKGMLGIFGYQATVEPFYLIGDNGSIFMLKSCLGLQTILLFAAFIVLTGNARNRTRFIFILVGFLLLNLSNILRFVFLFIHIQKNGDYKLAMDVHDMYNYIIYGIVFFLWVIWFERFADKPYRQIVSADQSNLKESDF